MNKNYGFTIKTYLFLIIFSVLLNTTYAQEVLWLKQTADVNPLEGVNSHKMVVDKDGNVYVLYFLRGRSLFEGDLVQSNGVDDILVVKFNAAGKIVWKRQMGGDDWDQGSDIAIDNSGNILLTGIMESGGDFLGETLDPANGGAFVGKIDQSGALIWVKQYGNSFGQGQSVAVDHNDNVIVGGRSNLEDLVIRKYSPAGEILWSVPIDYITCCVTPQVDDIQISSTNNIIVTGSFVGDITFSGNTLRARNYYSAFILKYDQAGTYEWSNQVDGGNVSDSYARGGDLAIDGDDNIYITGHFRTNATFDDITLTEKNVLTDRTGYFAKLTSAGNFLWAKPFHGLDAAVTRVKMSADLKEVNIIGIGYQYDDQYASGSESSQSTYLLVTDLDGDFKRVLNSQISVNDMVFDTQDHIYVTGGFMDDKPVGCFMAIVGGFYTAFLYKATVFPDVQLTGQQLCTDTDIVIKAVGAGEAETFSWIFPEGFTSNSGSFETSANEIIVRTEDKMSAYVSVIPGYACYLPVEYTKTFALQDPSMDVTCILPTGINDPWLASPYLYPNPASGNVLLDISSLEQFDDATVQVLDIRGMIVKQMKSTTMLVEWDTHSFAKGLYFVKVNSGGQTFVTRLVIE